MVKVSGEIELIVLDKNGKVIKQFSKPMDSFVKNFMYYIYFADPWYWVATDKNGNSVTFNPPSNGDDYFYNAYILAGEGEDNFGIIVGNSDASFNVAQYWLQSQIMHGTSSGQLEYGATSVAEYGDDYKTWQRAFDNSSGADVVVKEIGIAVKVNRYEGGSIVPYYILLARDVITSTTVPNGGRLIVKYKFKINP